ncbi:universal stress protein [Gordonia polyisoprenivorans]|uniref:universal stress protein n=1 Tax=Gordonia polyisoprenivorans TaxID=84595 RepID=UPI001FCC1141|nr:universal stress protein [Gordonia polyisoprenivorans]
MTPRTALVVGRNRHPDSVAAVRFAVMLARRLDAHVHVVHIVDLDDEPLDPDAPDWDQQFAATVDRDALAARDLLDTLPASWTSTVDTGRPPTCSQRSPTSTRHSSWRSAARGAD